MPDPIDPGSAWMKIREDDLRKARAEAWDEGHDAATDAAPEDVWFGAWSFTTNPYRIEGGR